MVLKSSQGAQMIFRYPPILRKRISQQTMANYSKDKNSPLQREPSLRSSLIAPREEEKNDTLPAEVYSWPSVVIAPMLAPHVRLCDQAFELLIGDTLFVGWPVSFGKPDAEASDEERVQLRTINCCFALSRGAHSNAAQFHAMSAKLAAALKHEEERCSYLSRELKRISSIRESWIHETQRHPGSPDHYRLT